MSLRKSTTIVRCTALACGLTLGLSARAADVVIVRGGDVPAHAEALAAFKKVATVTDALEIEARGSVIDPAVQEKLRTVKPKVLLALGDGAAKAAAALKVGTVVHAFVTDPSKIPGAVGVSSSVPANVRLKALASLSAGIHTVGVLHGATTKADVDALASEAANLGLTVTGKQISGMTSIPPSLRELLGVVDALVVIPDEALGTSEALKFVFENVLQANKPALSYHDGHLSQGALLVVTPDPADVGAKLGELVNGILGGSPRPGELSPAASFVLSVNVRAAQHLGFDVDTSGATMDGNVASWGGTREAPPVVGPPRAAAAVAAALPDTPPSAVETVPPEYPPMARKQKLTGEVLLDVTVGTDGNVVDAKILRGSAMFNQAAKEAVMKYRFQPARKGGQPAEGSVQVTISFGL